MDIHGQSLIDLLRVNTRPIQLRCGREMVCMLSPSEALRKAVSGLYVGIGSPSRIRHLRRAEECSPIRPLAASCFTRRVRNDAGVIVAARKILEHKDVCR